LGYNGQVFDAKEQILKEDAQIDVADKELKWNQKANQLILLNAYNLVVP
jgi:hypothetical protein